MSNQIKVLLPLNKKEIKAIYMMMDVFNKYSHELMDISEKEIVEYTYTIAYIKKMIELQQDNKII